jgi:excisionase family DNA binding protein
VDTSSCASPGAPASSSALLDIAQAAALIGAKPRFVRRLLDERRLTYVRIGPRHTRIRREDLDDYLATRVVEALEDTP